MRTIRRSSGLLAIAWAACVMAGLPVSCPAAADLDRRLPSVERIEILGNRSFDDRTLKKRMRTKEARFYHIFSSPRYRADMLRRDVAAIQSFYRSNGYFETGITVDSVIANAKANSVRIRLLVNEGPQIRVAAVSFAGQDIIGPAQLREGLRLTEGRPYNPNLIEADRYTLFSKYFERGYLGSKIAYEVRVDSTEARLGWEISPGKPMSIRDVRVVGAVSVKERLVRRELTFQNGELFKAGRVLDSKQNLYDTGYFNSVEIEPDSIDLDTREVDLVVRLRERKKGYIETGFGFGNVHGNRLFGEWGQRNIFGRGYALSLKSQYSFQLFPNNEYSMSKIDFRSKYMRHEGEIRFPHVLSTWNTLGLGAFYARDATVEPIIVTEQGFAARLSRRFTRKTSGMFGYSLGNVKRHGTGIEESRSLRRSFGVDFTRDARDSYFNPHQGSHYGAEGSYAGGFLGGDDNYYSIAGTVQRYVRLGGDAVFAWRVRAGYADAFGDSRETGVPVESRFYTGGGNSVRGFRENSLGPVNERGDPLGGRVQILTNVELRFGLPYLRRWNFGGAVFLDGGNVWSSLNGLAPGDFAIRDGDASREEYLYGAGFGVRYNTPVGPIRFDVGFPLKKTADMDYDHRIHISLGQIF